MQFKKRMGYSLNLNCPQTFDEKLNWLKLYNRTPLYTKLVDKYEVKRYVAEKIGSEHVIPPLGVWDKFDDIDFEKLPRQFVLKCTHDSGGLVICKDKATFDFVLAKEKITRALHKNYYWECREWPYKKVKPRIMAEKYMEDSVDAELRDYKFYTFDGVPKFLLLATNRQCSERQLSFDYFDMDFNHLPLQNHWHPNNSVDDLHKPSRFEEMKRLIPLLTSGMPQVRVDFYEVDGHVYFGELTFFDQGGYLMIQPNSWELEWGRMIKLPEKK